MTTKKGDFLEKIPTQEEHVEINVSFSDEIEAAPPNKLDPPAQEKLLLQVGAEGNYTCAYLGRKQVDALILALQQARSIWYANW